MTRILLSLGLAVGIGLTAVGSARSTFPGGNGLLVFVTHEGPLPESIFSIDPKAGSVSTAPAPDGLKVFPSIVAWSRDGSRLAYVAYENGEPTANPIIYVWSPGGRPKRVAVGDRPAWSPDGRKLAFYVPNRQRQIVVFDLRTGRVHRIVRRDGGPPAWSPNGARLAYGGAGGGGRWAVAADGGPPRRLVRQAAVAEAPAWSPDGRHIAYVDAATQKYDLHVVRLRSVGSTKALSSRTVATSAQGPVWSPDGGLLAFDQGTVHLVRPDGGGARALKARVFSEQGQPSIAWSPDGKSIATVAADGGGLARAGLSVVRVSTGTVQEFLSDSFKLSSVSWPTSRRILVSGDRERVQHIAVAAPDGSGQRVLTAGTSFDSGPRWSPDGARIAFAGDRDGDFELFVMNADGSDVRQVTHNQSTDAQPSWSPDGTKLAFASDRSGSTRVWTIGVDGSGARAVPGTNGTSAPLWSPAGRWIAYTVPSGSPIGPSGAIADSEGGVLCQTAYAPVMWSPDGSMLELFPNKLGEVGTANMRCQDAGSSRNAPFVWAPDDSRVIPCPTTKPPIVSYDCDTDWQPLRRTAS